MTRQAQHVDAIIVQNANAYLDGLTQSRQAFFRSAHDDRSPARIAALHEFVSKDAIINRQYLRDVPADKRDIMSPDAWTHDLAFLDSDKARKVQVQLFQDYQTNIDLYPTWQATMRASLPGLDRVGRTGCRLHRRWRQGLPERPAGCRAPSPRRWTFRRRGACE